MYFTACIDYIKVLCLRHKGDNKENEHFHLVVYTQVKPKAFRARMVGVYDKGKGNGHMSIKPFDGNEDALAYMFHEEGAPIVLNKGFAETDIERFRERNLRVQEEVVKAKGKASFLLEEEVFNILSKKNERFSDRDIATVIIRTAFDSGKYLPSDFQIRSMVDKISFRLCNGNIAEEVIFIDTMVNRIYRN